MQFPPQKNIIVRFEVAPRSIVWLLATIAGIWLFLQLHTVILLLVVALVFAGALNPLIEWMERHGIRRTYALLLVFVASLLATSLLIFLTVPPLTEQLTRIVHDAPHHRNQLILLLQQHEVTAPLARMVQGAGLEQLFTGLEGFVVSSAPQALLSLGWAVTALMLSFYLLADGKRAQGVLYAIIPRDYHMRLARILQNLEVIVGGYMRGQLITSAAIGTFTFLLLTACQVPNALSLALFAAVADVIPFVGTMLATVPAALAALFTYQEMESRVLIPRIYGRTLRLAPTTVVLALLAGAILLGVIGALLALPVAAGVQMVFKELRLEMPGDDSDDLAARAHHAETEATYEKMSAGASAPEAGQIARHLAHEMRDADAVRAVAAAD